MLFLLKSSDMGEVDDDLTDLVEHFQRLRIVQDEHRICQPNTDQRVSCADLEFIYTMHTHEYINTILTMEPVVCYDELQRLFCH